MRCGAVAKLALVITGVALLAACARATPTPAPGAAPPKPVVRVYHLHDITGPVSILAVPALEGTLDWSRYWNQKYGGVNGHPLEQVYVDTGYEVPRAIALYARFKAEKPPLVFFYSTGSGEALKPSILRDNIMGINLGSSDPQLYPPENMFTYIPSYGDQAAAFLNWVKATWKGDRPPRIGFITYDNPYGRAIIEPGSRYAKYLGFEFVGTDFIGWVPADSTPQLVKMRDAGANFIYGNLFPQTMAPMLRDMDKLGLKGKIQLAGHVWSTLDKVVELAGPELAEGTIAWWTGPMPDEALPGVDVVMQQLRASGRKVAWVHMDVWRMMDITAQALKLAMDAVGYDKLTSIAVKEQGFEKLKDYQGPFTWGRKVTIKPNDRRIITEGRLIQVRGGKPVPITDFTEVPHLFPPEFANLFPGQPAYK